MKKTNQPDAAPLRKKAEAMLKTRRDVARSDSTEPDTLKLIHELEVHQIELELQNEELQLAKQHAELAAEKYTSLYDFAPSGYFTLSADGEIMELNLSGARMLGKERSRFVNSSFVFFVSGESKPAFNHFLSEVFRSKASVTCDVALTIDGGNPYLINLTGVCQESGERCLMTAVDITERRQAEMALIESENHSRSIIEAIPDLMFVLNSEGVYLDFKADVADLAYQKESIIGKKNRDLMPPDFADLIDEKIKRTLQTGSSQFFEYQLDIPQKGICYFEARMVQCGNDRVLAIVRNITESKISDAKIRQINEQLTELNATKDKFFNIIAHDLKSPFNSIVGFSDLLVEMASVNDYSQVGKYAGIIHQSSHRAIDLLMNLTEWARAQTGRIEFNPEIFEMDELINDVVKLLLDNAAQKKIRISKILPSRGIAKADKAMISTVLRNLVANAIKFTKPGGEIILSVSENNSGLTVAVNDNGIGIPAHLTGKLFRLDGSFTTRGTEKEQGTGLGLILCKEFIEKHHGTIWVESTEGKGSTFSFTLPG